MRKISLSLSLLLFIGLFFAYHTPQVHQIDIRVLLFFEDIRTTFFNYFFTMITTIGSIKVLLPLCVLMSAYLLFKKRYLEIVLLWVLFWTSRGINFLLKEAAGRARPDVHQLVEVHDYSFPSGHSMNSIATLGFISYLLTVRHNIKQTKREVSYFVAGIIILLIVLSRLYLGVHYPTDVLAGLCIGYLFLQIFIQIHRSMKEKWPTRPPRG